MRSNHREAEGESRFSDRASRSLADSGFSEEKAAGIEQKYDYRYSVLIFVFATLVKEGWLRETDLKGLSEDKLGKIKFLTNPERFQKN